MDIRIPWLLSRKKIIFNCLIDILLIYILNNFIFGEYLKFAENISIFTISIIPFWLVYSYIIGRYSYSEFVNSNSLLNSFFAFFIKTFLIAILSIATVFIFSINIDLNNYNHFDKISLFYTLILSTFINLFELPFFFFFLKNSRRVEKWAFIGSKSIFDSLNEEVKSARINIKIINVKIENDFLFEDFYNFSGIFSDSFSEISNKTFKELLSLKGRGIKIINIQDWSEIYLQRFPSEFISKKNLLLGNFNKSYNNLEMRLKRLGDLILGLVLIILTSPIVLIASLFIYFEDRKCIFYKQYRVGLNQKIFKIYKLRTMKLNAEKDGPQWSVKNDNRITKIGKLLRNFRIDELPQLICVIKGEMSLIGPRPERYEIDQKLINFIPHYNLRYLIKPGLSGWAQVNYSYGASLNDSKKKFSYDLFYLRNFSLWLDFLILLKTIKLVILKKGSVPLK